MSILTQIRAYWKFDDAKPKDFKTNQPSFKDATGRANDLLVMPDQRPATSSLDFRIGANNHGNQQVDGAQAAWGIWKRKLTDPEKAALAGGETWPFSTTPSLADAAAYYLLDESSGAATYVDATGRGNDLARSGTTTQVAGPAGITHGTQFTPGAYLHVAPTADLQAGNVDHTICGWAKLNSKTFADQQIYWGQIDINVSPAQTADVVYYEGTYDTFNVDLGNGVDTIGNGVAVVQMSPVLGQWYFLLTDYDAVTSVETMAVDNGTASEFEHNYWSTTSGIIGNASNFRLQPDFRLTDGGWDTPNVPFLIAPTAPDLTFRDGSSKSFWCWFKADSTAGSQLPIAGFYNFAAGKINWLFFISGGTLYFYVGNGTAGSSFAAATLPFTDTASFHLAVCWYDSGTNTVHLDLDHGASTASVSLGAVVVTPSLDPYMVVAANTDGSGFNNQFRGIVDEMGLADGVPTSADLDALWSSGTGVSPIFPTSRLGLARLGRMRLGVAAAIEAITPTLTTFPITFSSSNTLSHLTHVTPTLTTFPIHYSSLNKIAFRFGANIIPTPTRMPINFGISQLSGGETRLQIWVGGQDVTRYVHQRTCSLSSSTKGRWTAQFKADDVAGTGIGIMLASDPTRGTGQAVVITEGGRRIFMGCVNEIAAARALCNSFVQYTVSCIDKSGICDHRIVPTTTYAAGTDIANVVRDIWNRALGGEGISIAGVPVSLGALENDEIFDLCTVTQAFDRLATDALASWWIDVYGRLYFVLITDLPDAPFELTETSANWRDMVATASLTNYRNKQYVKSNLSMSPTGVPSVTETYVLPQAKAVAAGYRLGTIVLNFSANQIITLRVNGVLQPVRNGYDIGLNFDKSWWAILPTPYLYAPDAGLPTPTPPLGFPYYSPISAFPVIGDVIEINYIPNVNNAQVEEASALIPSLPGLLKCGSGIYEVVEQVKNIRSAADLQAIAQAILARSGQVPLGIAFKTFTPGLAVGQALRANIVGCQIPNNRYMITGVQAMHDGNCVDFNGAYGLGHGSGYEWQIQATSGADQLNAIGMFEKLVGRTENPLPDPQYEVETLILEPGSSISSGTVSTNPTIARRSGKLVEVVVIAGVPPTDQTLVIDVINSAYGSILGSKNLIKVTSGDGSRQVQTIFVSDPAPTYILINQGLTILASYESIGANPARAGSVTVLVRWQV